MRTSYAHLTINPVTLTVTDNATRAEVGRVFRDGDDWRAEGPAYRTGRWESAYAAADALWAVATAGRDRVAS
jgi:hypothetical protein